MLKNVVFYTLAGTVITLIAQAVGATWIITLFLALLLPPVILLVILILRYKGML
jgi:hypothetical protein